MEGVAKTIATLYPDADVKFYPDGEHVSSPAVRSQRRSGWLISALSRTRRLLVIVGLVAAATTALATATSAFAEENYSCSSCAVTSGPNEDPTDNATAINYSGYGVCANLWQYKGGSNYEDMGIKCTPDPEAEYETSYYGNGLEFSGHGSTEHYFDYNYHMAGHQWYG